MARFILKPLPYATDALMPAMSARTVEVHHREHQGGYAKKLNALIEHTDHAHDDLDYLVIQSHSVKSQRAIYNNAAQLWNHEFFWESLSPNASRDPPSHIADCLTRRFGSVASFRDETLDVAKAHFASGWVWLVVLPGGRWDVVATHDADNPLVWGGHPLFVCDLWEHAYYLDWQQDRTSFVRAVLDHFIDWNRIASRLGQLQRRHAA
jgi:Fe-Mn family superoxide dismutase